MKRLRLSSVAFALAMAACVSPPVPPAMAQQGSVVSGTIGVAVRGAGGAVVVSAVAARAASAGVRVGDRVLRYNGADIEDARQFERLVLESAPGTTARVELSGEGGARTLDLPVEQIRTGERG